MAHPIDTENLVLGHLYTSGHAQDLLSPYGNHGTLVGGEGFVRTDKCLTL